MSLDLKKALYEVHPSFVELGRTKSLSISDSTLERLAGKVHALNQEKKQRLRKVLIFVVQVSHHIIKAGVCMYLTAMCSAWFVFCYCLTSSTLGIDLDLIM